MATGYPAAIDNFQDPTAGDNLNTAGVIHATLHTNVNDAVNAIETELGTNPKGAAASVKARLDAIDTALTARSLAADEGAANGIATLDAGSQLVQNVDAGKMTTGILNVARVPNLDAAKITTGAFAVARIPSLDTAKITTGVFTAAQIPNLDGAKITTGTIAAARLPTSVTSNANSKVVADIAGRDAIPLIDRVDGMIVTVRTPWTQYTWRADNSTWNQTGGPGGISESPLEAYDATTLTTSIVTFDPGAPGLSQVFTAPQSGKIFVTLSSLIIITSGTGAGYFGAEVRAGNVVGSGTIIDSVATQKCVAFGGTSGGRSGASMRYLVPGLTAGNQYHVRTMFTTSSSPVATMQLFYRRVIVEMVH